MKTWRQLHPFPPSEGDIEYHIVATTADGDVSETWCLGMPQARWYAEHFRHLGYWQVMTEVSAECLTGCEPI